MPRTYLISWGVAAYCVGFCLVWFGGVVGFVIVGQLPHEWALADVGAILVALLFASGPAFALAFVPYRVTLTDDGACSFRSLFRERLVRVHRINEIDWDEDYVIIRHDSGKARILSDPVFKPLVKRLLELNPAIKIPDDLWRSLSSAS